MSKQKQEIIPKAERVKRAQTKHVLNDQKKRSRESLTIANRNKDDEFYTYYEVPKQVNTYYAIPTTAMLKFDGTEQFEIIQKKKLTPSINGKDIFARLLVRYTG